MRSKQKIPLWLRKAIVDVGLSRLGPCRSTFAEHEAVAIAFIGRPGTRSIGLPTGGLSTPNTTNMLPSGSMLVVTAALCAR
ncbi:MAG: hypothetical protein H7Z40_18905 [Phycisphaerae bacterium]|nr:hypothetical protein [Gemmatimonadaceae bacterium]